MFAEEILRAYQKQLVKLVFVKYSYSYKRFGSKGEICGRVYYPQEPIFDIVKTSKNSGERKRMTVGLSPTGGCRIRYEITEDQENEMNETGIPAKDIERIEPIRD